MMLIAKFDQKSNCMQNLKASPFPPCLRAFFFIFIMSEPPVISPIDTNSAENDISNSSLSTPRSRENQTPPSRIASRIPSYQPDSISNAPLDKRLEVCHRYYISGFFFLPFLWFLNYWLFHNSFHQFADSRDPNAKRLLLCNCRFSYFRLEPGSLCWNCVDVGVFDLGYCVSVFGWSMGSSWRLHFSKSETRIIISIDILIEIPKAPIRNTAFCFLYNTLCTIKSIQCTSLHISTRNPPSSFENIAIIAIILYQYIIP